MKSKWSFALMFLALIGPVFGFAAGNQSAITNSNLVRIDNVLNQPLNSLDDLVKFRENAKVLVENVQFQMNTNIFEPLKQTWGKPDSPFYGQLKVVEVLLEMYDVPKSLDQNPSSSIAFWLNFHSWLKGLSANPAFQINGQGKIIYFSADACKKAFNESVSPFLGLTVKAFNECQDRFIPILEEIYSSEVSTFDEGILRQLSHSHLLILTNFYGYRSKLTFNRFLPVTRELNTTSLYCLLRDSYLKTLKDFTQPWIQQIISSPLPQQ